MAVADYLTIELLVGFLLGLATLLPLLLWFARQWKKITADGKIELSEIVGLLTTGGAKVEEAVEDLAEDLADADNDLEAVVDAAGEVAEAVEEVATELKDESA